MDNGHGWRLLRLDAGWAEAVADLEQRVFSSAWDAAAYRRFFAQPTAWAAGAVAGGLAGYLVGRVVDNEAEVVNLAVHPAWRRQGVGRALVLAALEDWQRCGVTRAFLEVRAGNAAALALYARCGFVVCGRRRGYYTDPPEDAVLLVWERPGGCLGPENG